MNGEVYIFGGQQDSKKVKNTLFWYLKYFKIAKINDCRIEDTGIKLITNFHAAYGSLVTLKENSEKIILCNGYSEPLKCESFDGSEPVAIAETKAKHQSACMAINEQGRPTIIAGGLSSSVEILEIRFFIKIIKNLK